LLSTSAVSEGWLPAKENLGVHLWWRMKLSKFHNHQHKVSAYFLLHVDNKAIQ
jgi:hypothetical protein